MLEFLARFLAPRDLGRHLGQFLGIQDFLVDPLGQVLELIKGLVEFPARFRFLGHFLAVAQHPLEVDRLLELVDGDLGQGFDHRDILLGDLEELVTDVVELDDSDRAHGHDRRDQHDDERHELRREHKAAAPKFDCLRFLCRACICRHNCVSPRLGRKRRFDRRVPPRG